MQPRNADSRRHARETNPIGFALAEARVKAKLSINQVSEITKVRSGLIKEIEYGDFSGAGGDIYARGHIRAMAIAVGLDPEPLVAQFEAKHGVPEQAPVPTKLLAVDPAAVKEYKEHRGTRWLVPASVAMGVLAVIAGVGLITGPGNHPAGPPLATSSTQTPQTVIPTQAANNVGAKASTDSNPQSLLAFAGVDLVLRVTSQRSWIHVEDSTGKVLFEGTLSSGASKEFKSSGPIKGVLGNAGAVDMTLNGHHLGSPDGFGKIFSFTFAPGDDSITGTN